MFRATLLPSASVYGTWTSVKDVCVWAAVDDEMWNQFAGALGDASLQILSLLASMQPGDIKEAIEASASGAVGRTKLRLVYAAARLKFDSDPIDVGAPTPTVAAEPAVVVGPRGGTYVRCRAVRSKQGRTLNAGPYVHCRAVRSVQGRTFSAGPCVQ